MQPLIDPIEFGRLVTYRDWDGWLRGWNVSDDREACTVRRCKWEGGRWQIDLMDGTTIGVHHIEAVAELDSAGQIIGSWTTQEPWQEGEYAR